MIRSGLCQVDDFHCWQQHLFLFEIEICDYHGIRTIYLDYKYDAATEFSQSSQTVSRFYCNFPGSVADFYRSDNFIGLCVNNRNII